MVAPTSRTSAPLNAETVIPTKKSTENFQVDGQSTITSMSSSSFYENFSPCKLIQKIWNQLCRLFASLFGKTAQPEVEKAPDSTPHPISEPASQPIPHPLSVSEAPQERQPSPIPRRQPTPVPQPPRTPTPLLSIPPSPTTRLITQETFSELNLTQQQQYLNRLSALEQINFLPNCLPLVAIDRIAPLLESLPFENRAPILNQYVRSADNSRRQGLLSDFYPRWGINAPANLRLSLEGLPLELERFMIVENLFRTLPLASALPLAQTCFNLLSHAHQNTLLTDKLSGLTNEEQAAFLSNSLSHFRVEYKIERLNSILPLASFSSATKSLLLQQTPIPFRDLNFEALIANLSEEDQKDVVNFSCLGLSQADLKAHLYSFVLKNFSLTVKTQVLNGQLPRLLPNLQSLTLLVGLRNHEEQIPLIQNYLVSLSQTDRFTKLNHGLLSAMMPLSRQADLLRTCLPLIDSIPNQGLLLTARLSAWPERERLSLLQQALPTWPPNPHIPLLKASLPSWKTYVEQIPIVKELLRQISADLQAELMLEFLLRWPPAHRFSSFQACVQGWTADEQMDLLGSALSLCPSRDFTPLRDSILRHLAGTAQRDALLARIHRSP